MLKSEDIVRGARGLWSRLASALKGRRVEDTKRDSPRPKAKPRVEFATRTRIAQHPLLEKDFVQRVLELEWAWISDESTLWDFHTELTNDKYVDSIRRIYGVDVSDIPKGNLADIFDRIDREPH